jgi:hypothetical protein
MIVLHIGLRKSGSSSIQAFFAQHADTLTAMSVDYPRVGRMGRHAHVNLANELLGRDRFRPDAGALADLIDHRRSASAETLVVSSEMFEALPGEAVLEFRDILAVLDEPVRIILVIRDLVSLTPSSYAQKVRYGHKKYDFDRFFETRRTQDRVDYFATAKRWADVFGRESLTTIALGPQLIEDFVSAAGLPPRVASLQQPGVVNAASGWRVLEAMRAFHRGSRLVPADHPMNLVAATCARLGRIDAYPHEIRLETAARAAGDAMGWMEDRGAYMTLEQAEWCAKTHDDAVAAINAYFHSDLPAKAGLASREFVAREFLPSASSIPARELRTFYDAVGDRLLSDPSLASADDDAGA